ncbi:MAG: hypothetical protein ACJAZ8_002902 [Planctomycetota bacterium]|jgi:hypothetical protein
MDTGLENKPETPWVAGKTKQPHLANRGGRQVGLRKSRGLLRALAAELGFDQAAEGLDADAL